MKGNYHIPVLLNESTEGLAVHSGGVYVDATFGGGGHSKRILEMMNEGKLIAFDQDSDAIDNIIEDERLIFVHHNFKYLKNFLRFHGYNKVDGILADLGVSSHDFDVAERGFSFRFDSKLDMRMNQTREMTAEQIINEYDGEELIRIFFEYGELNNAKKTSEIIVTARQKKRIGTTFQLGEVLEPIVPKKAASKYLAKVFQALRIEVNQELEVLKSLLEDSAEVLNPGGRLVVISYHSLEDRLVKNFIQKGNFSGEAEKDFFGNIQLKFKSAGKKLISPSEKEISINPRARSAKLRIAERV